MILEEKIEYNDLVISVQDETTAPLDTDDALAVGNEDTEQRDGTFTNKCFIALFVCPDAWQENAGRSFFLKFFYFYFGLFEHGELVAFS